MPFEEGADVYIINTCTVTNIADRKSRQMLHKAQENEPGCRSCGDRLLCPDRDTEDWKQTRAVDIDTWKQQKERPDRRALDEYYNAHAQSKVKSCIEINHDKGIRGACHRSPIQQSMPVPISKSRTGATSSVLTASFRMREDVSEAVTWNMYLEEVRTLAASGYKEVVLTGIHLSSYGIDTGESLLELNPEST